MSGNENGLNLVLDLELWNHSCVKQNRKVSIFFSSIS